MFHGEREIWQKMQTAGRAAVKGKQERVPHLHLKLSGCLFAALYLVGAAVISADRRHAASVQEMR